MKNSLLIVILSILMGWSIAKPIYDFKTSYITTLTSFNFKDQVTKIRQNTNYVAIVHYYKYTGNSTLI